MKTILSKFLLIVVLLAVLPACEDKLELVDPNNVDAELALSTDKSVKAALLGAYNGLSAGAFFGGNTLRNSELLAANDEVVFSGTFNDVSDLYRKEMITANADVTNMWVAAYNTINICNNILGALEVVNEDDRSQIQGEALFIRGLSYFELILFFAPPYSAGNAGTNLGVPILLEEDANSLELKPRNTLQEVYTQILDDLTTAEGLLEEGPRSGKATKEAAAAILSRVYLQMENYQDARDAANRVINTGNYSLIATTVPSEEYSDVFNGSSTKEDLFDIPVSTVDGVNNMQVFYAAANPFGGRGDIEVQQSHLDLYDANDDRLGLFYEDEGTGDIRVGKWTNPFGNVKIIRLAEMYLTRAECNERLGTTIGDTPLNDVNRIRERVNLANLGSVTLADILFERRLELAHEGQRLHDAKRLQESIQLGAEIFTFDSDLLVFPIPQREIDVNSNLVQNDGYN